MTYRAPINDMLLALNHGAGLQAAVKAGHYGDFDADITAAVLEEAGKFATDVLAPLNKVGDEHGIKLDAGAVVTLPASSLMPCSSPTRFSGASTSLANFPASSITAAVISASKSP